MASSCFARQGCTGQAPDRALRGHRRPCNLGRIASPVRTNLVFGSDRGRLAGRNLSLDFVDGDAVNSGWERVPPHWLFWCHVQTLLALAAASVAANTWG